MIVEVPKSNPKNLCDFFKNNFEMIRCQNKFSPLLIAGLEPAAFGLEVQRAAIAPNKQSRIFGVSEKTNYKLYS